MCLTARLVVQNPHRQEFLTLTVGQIVGWTRNVSESASEKQDLDKAARGMDVFVQTGASKPMCTIICGFWCFALVGGGRDRADHLTEAGGGQLMKGHGNSTAEGSLTKFAKRG